GSSREHAPWALADYGFKVIIAPSYADIFYSNCLKNGLLPVVLEENDVRSLIKEVNNGRSKLNIDLQNQKVKDESDSEIPFKIDPYWKDMLLEGKDEIDVTLDYEQKIAEYEHNTIIH